MCTNIVSILVTRLMAPPKGGPPCRSYQRTAERPIREIAGGRLLDGERLFEPPERDMAAALGIFQWATIAPNRLPIFQERAFSSAAGVGKLQPPPTGSGRDLCLFSGSEARRGR